MATDKNSNQSSGRERRKKIRRLGKERREQVRWDNKDPIRRKGPGRRALDFLTNALDLLKR